MFSDFSIIIKYHPDFVYIFLICNDPLNYFDQEKHKYLLRAVAIFVLYIMKNRKDRTGSFAEVAYLSKNKFWK
jgi:hypothetical protein